MTIAQTILAQLGSGRFAMMTGAKNFVALEDGLTFKIGRNDKKITHVTIRLNSMDLYDVEYCWVRGTTKKVRATSEGIYADMLREDFERETGLYTSLGTMGRK